MAPPCEAQSRIHVCWSLAPQLMRPWVKHHRPVFLPLVRDNLVVCAWASGGPRCFGDIVSTCDRSPHNLLGPQVTGQTARGPSLIGNNKVIVDIILLSPRTDRPFRVRVRRSSMVMERQHLHASDRAFAFLSGTSTLWMAPIGATT